jgi:hypothetical protein
VLHNGKSLSAILIDRTTTAHTTCCCGYLYVNVHLDVIRTTNRVQRLSQSSLMLPVGKDRSVRGINIHTMQIPQCGNPLPIAQFPISESRQFTKPDIAMIEATPNNNTWLHTIHKQERKTPCSKDKYPKLVVHRSR